MPVASASRRRHDTHPLTPACDAGVEAASLVAARPQMIAMLDTFRGTLEDLGGGLGVTDPVSGEVVHEM